MKGYRFDCRTEEQFIEDVKRGTERERLAISLFQGFLEKELGVEVVVEDNGVDMTGNFIHDERMVTAGADFKVNGLPLEVKTSKNHLMKILLKKSQVRSYIHQNASLLFVSGIGSDQLAFTFFTVEDLKRIQKTAKIEQPEGRLGGKTCFAVETSELQFMSFDGKGITFHEERA